MPFPGAGLSYALKGPHNLGPVDNKAFLVASAPHRPLHAHHAVSWLSPCLSPSSPLLLRILPFEPTYLGFGEEETRTCSPRTLLPRLLPKIG